MTYSFFFSRFWWSLSRQFVPLPSFHLQVTVESFSLVRGRRKVEEAGFRRLKLRLPAPADLSRFPFHWHNSQMWSVSSTSTLEHSCSPLPAGRLWALSFLPFLFSIAPAHSAFRTAHTRSPTGTFICHLRHFAVPSIVTVLYMSVCICLLLSACLNCFCEYECELSCPVLSSSSPSSLPLAAFPISPVFFLPVLIFQELVDCRLWNSLLCVPCKIEKKRREKGKEGKLTLLFCLQCFLVFLFSLFPFLSSFCIRKQSRVDRRRKIY